MQLNLLEPCLVKVRDCVEVFTVNQQQLRIPSVIHQALEHGAALAISISGGADSQALLIAVVKFHRAMQYPGKLFAIFADLGRIEWLGTKEQCQKLCHEYNVELVVVRRNPTTDERFSDPLDQGDMVDRWWQRYQSIVWADQEKEIVSINQTISSKPPFSDKANRFCTKELKTAPIDKALRANNLLICAVGIRAQESTDRQYQPWYSVRSDITTSSLKEPASVKPASKKTEDKNTAMLKRQQWADSALEHWLAGGCSGKLAFTWNAIIDWLIESVWQCIGHSLTDLEQRRNLFAAGQIETALIGWKAHWAYVSGNNRLSCALCVLASKNDVKNGAIHNPLLWLELVTIQLVSGWKFTKNLDLLSLKEFIVAVDSGYYRTLKNVLTKLKLIQPATKRLKLLTVGSLPMLVVQVWSYECLNLLLVESIDV